jgi:phage baseplate assembly protein W
MAITQSLRIARLYKDIDMAFTKNALSGDINKKLDVNAVKQSIRNLLLTKPYERPFHPELGSRLYAALFEQMRPGLEQTLARMVEQQILNFEPRVDILNVQVTPDYDNNSYDFSIRFLVKGINEPQDLSLSLTRLR